MGTESVINKVVITAEAEFDYVSETDSPMPKADIKRETEDYINGNLQRFGGYYFRAKYPDETTDRMLMLFFYKGKTFGKMQIWELRGICQADDWSEELEESGQVRLWLNTSLEPNDTTDWVWDLRIQQEKHRQELAEEFGEEEESIMPGIKELLDNYKINKARIAVGNSKEVAELKADMEYLDRCIDQLDDEAKAIIVHLYVQGESMSTIGRWLGYSKQAVHKKRNRAMSILEILFADRV